MSGRGEGLRTNPHSPLLEDHTRGERQYVCTQPVCTCAHEWEGQGSVGRVRKLGFYSVTNSKSRKKFKQEPSTTRFMFRLQ